MAIMARNREVRLPAFLWRTWCVFIRLGAGLKPAFRQLGDFAAFRGINRDAVLHASGMPSHRDRNRHTNRTTRIRNVT
jgi:hypothetical protein